MKKVLIFNHRSVLNIALKTQEIAFPRLPILKFLGEECPPRKLAPSALGGNIFYYLRTLRISKKNR